MASRNDSGSMWPVFISSLTSYVKICNVNEANKHSIFHQNWIGGYKNTYLAIPCFLVSLYDAKKNHLYIQSMILRELPTPEAFNRKQKLVFIYVNMKCLFHFPFRTVFSRAFQYPSIATTFCILAFSFCKMTHKKTNVDKLL